MTIVTKPAVDQPENNRELRGALLTLIGSQLPSAILLALFPNIEKHWWGALSGGCAVLAALALIIYSRFGRRKAKRNGDPGDWNSLEDLRTRYNELEKQNAEIVGRHNYAVRLHNDKDIQLRDALLALQAHQRRIRNLQEERNWLFLGARAFLVTASFGIVLLVTRVYFRGNEDFWSWMPGTYIRIAGALAVGFLFGLARPPTIRPALAGVRIGFAGVWVAGFLVLFPTMLIKGDQFAAMQTPMGHVNLAWYIGTLYILVYPSCGFVGSFVGALLWRAKGP